MHFTSNSDHQSPTHSLTHSLGTAAFTASTSALIFPSTSDCLFLLNFLTKQLISAAQRLTQSFLQEEILLTCLPSFLKHCQPLKRFFHLHLSLCFAIAFVFFIPFFPLTHIFLPLRKDFQPFKPLPSSFRSLKRSNGLMGVEESL
mmetsp:Transcript_23719/g.46596  ORF Transcript_23719/g.46596 Transcript_23719/m.46596 type:complete len:145 (+) Transcript_23719:298-732(+)